MTLILGFILLDMQDAPGWHYLLLTVIWIISLKVDTWRVRG